MAKFEIYGTAGCPYTQEMREWLEFRGCEFVEYDVEADAEARGRCGHWQASRATFPAGGGWAGHAGRLARA